MSNDVFTDYQNAEQARAVKMKEERDARVRDVKNDLRPFYNKAVEELPRLRKALGEAREFLSKVIPLSVPQGVALIIGRLASEIEYGDKMVVMGIDAFEKLSFQELESRQGVSGTIRNWLRNYDGKAEYLKSLQDQITLYLREMAQSSNTPAPTVNAIQAIPRVIVKDAVTEFDARETA